MLTHIRKGAATLVGLALLSGPALAVDHEIIIIDGAYFPPIVFAEHGDNLVFINESSGVHKIVAANGGWETGSIPVDGTYSLALEPGMDLSYMATPETEGQGGETGDTFLEQFGEVRLGAVGAVTGFASDMTMADDAEAAASYTDTGD